MATYDFIHLQDQKAAATDGGTATSGAWRTRDITNIVSDVGGHATLPGSNQFTLAAGTYVMPATKGSFVDTNNSQIKLRNITDSTDVFDATQGAFVWANDESTGTCFIAGEFTIGSTKTFEIQYRVATTKATIGLGDAINLGLKNVYLDIILWKEDPDTQIDQTCSKKRYARASLSTIFNRINFHNEVLHRL